MLSKKWLLGAIGGAMLAGVASTAQAAGNVTNDLRLVAIDGVAVTDTKAAEITHAGQVFTFQLWVAVTGNDFVRNEGLQAIQGSLVSQLAKGNGGATGHFVASAPTWTQDDFGDWVVDPVGGVSPGCYPFQGNGTALGKSQNLGVYGADDSSLDMGGVPGVFQGTDAAGVIALRADALQLFPQSTSDARLNGGAKVLRNAANQIIGVDYRVGQFDWVADNIAGKGNGDQTSLQFLPRMDSLGVINTESFLGQVDGVANINASGVTLGEGAAIILTNPLPIPEPASLSVLALGALGLLARRRK